jgi:hypothetical protein
MRGEIILTPDGGKKLKFRELPTLIEDTMTCEFALQQIIFKDFNVDVFYKSTTVLAVAILTLVKEDEIKVYPDGVIAPPLPKYQNEKVYEDAEERMRNCWASKQIRREVMRAVADARDKAYRRLNKTCFVKRQINMNVSPRSSEVTPTEKEPVELNDSTEAVYGSSGASSNMDDNTANTNEDIYSTPGASRVVLVDSRSINVDEY